MNPITAAGGASNARVIGFEMKKWFFDTRWAKVAVDKAARKVLSRFGAFVRQSARSSIPSSHTISRPGQPPHSHVGAQRRAANRRRKAQGAAPIMGGRQGIRDIWFAWDQSHRSVVIGPIKYNGYDFKPGTNESGTIPEVLEYGGSLEVMEHQYPGQTTGQWFRADKRYRGRHWLGHKFRRRRYTIAPRPFMVPALTREQPKLPGMWAGAIN